MNRNVFAVSNNIITSLGFTTEENFVSMRSGHSAIQKIEDKRISQVPICTSRIDEELLNEKFTGSGSPEKFTHLEKLLILSVKEALRNTEIDIKSDKTIIIFSTTKGNIDLMEKEHDFGPDRIHLWNTANQLKKYFNNPNTPINISNACISGITAIITGANLIAAGRFDHAVVVGGDIISEFTPSGFQSFKAISEEPCKPFDADRDGITLGEAAGTIILSKDAHKGADHNFQYLGGANSNDANHISGPSRTGDGLYYAIRNAVDQSGLIKEEIDYISAHGTATLYNDEMEAKAINWAELQDIPVNSLKSYWGHTLGAAGIIETALGIYCMKENTLLKTLNYKKHGVSKPLNVLTANSNTETNSFLKTASGFGGCNAALIFKKIQ